MTNYLRRVFTKHVVSVAGLILLSQNALALELDWSGQFWSEYNFIHNYSMDSSDQGQSADPSRMGTDGYYVPGGGEANATFQSLFLRLRPKAIVNDNVYLKSEWWLGDPIFGMFGNSVPYQTEQRQSYSLQSRGSPITAQRFWGEFITDLGTFQAGRVPLNWGLGIVWNSGDTLWSRYMSTGDAIRWIAKFGAFSFIPSFIVSSTGNTIGGSCVANNSGVCQTGIGTGGVTDYSLILKYDNSEEDLETGVNIIKRLAGANQDPRGGLITSVSASSSSPTTGEMNYLTYDFFAKKKINHFTFSGEVPVITGSIAGLQYHSYAIAGEAEWKKSENWELSLKLGHASGQNDTGGPGIDAYRAFYFHPNYKIAMILFNYQLANFAGPQTQNNPNIPAQNLQSPYASSISDAQYIALSSVIRPTDKWSFKPSLIYARAPQTAISGQYFYNAWTQSQSSEPAVKNQGSSLGWEFDLSITFQWDDAFQFVLDQGFFFPGNFYAFSNTGVDNARSAVMATSVRVGVSF